MFLGGKPEQDSGHGGQTQAKLGHTTYEPTCTVRVCSSEPQAGQCSHRRDKIRKPGLHNTIRQHRQAGTLSGRTIGGKRIPAAANPSRGPIAAAPNSRQAPQHLPAAQLSKEVASANGVGTSPAQQGPKDRQEVRARVRVLEARLAVCTDRCARARLARYTLLTSRASALYAPINLAKRQLALRLPHPALPLAGWRPLRLIEKIGTRTSLSHKQALFVLVPAYNNCSRDKSLFKCCPQASSILTGGMCASRTPTGS